MRSQFDDARLVSVNPIRDLCYFSTKRLLRGNIQHLHIFSVKSTFIFHFQVISSNKSICTLHITDTTGSHQFPAMQRLSISKGHAFILVFSICSRQSLEELKPILELINEVRNEIYLDSTYFLFAIDLGIPRCVR